MLRMEAVTKIYRTQHFETHAVRSLNLHIREGEFVAVTGPSGSGKTTLLSIAGLLENCTSGSVELDGEDVHNLSDYERSKLRNRKIGFIFQTFNLIPDLDIYRNVEIPLRYRGLPRAERKQRIEASLIRVGLGSRMHHFPTELSGGQQQRAAIARAISGSPRLLLADEPTGNLDSEMTNGVMDLLAELHAGGATIIMVTHNNALAARAQRNVHIVDGNATDRHVKEPLANCSA